MWAGARIPSLNAVGLECVNPTPLSSIPFYISLQIPCSPVVAKQIYNSCAPYPHPSRLREIKKRALGYAHFFLRCGLDCCFPAFFSNFKPPPPPPLLPHMGFAVFLNIGLTEICIVIDVPPFPPHENLTKTPRGRQGNAKLIVRNRFLSVQPYLKLRL